MERTRDYQLFMTIKEKWNYLIAMPDIAPKKKSIANFHTEVKNILRSKESIPFEVIKKIKDILNSQINSELLSTYSKNDYLNTISLLEQIKTDNNIANMLPQHIKFIFLQKRKIIISNLIVYFILNVKYKNNYTIGPLITNEKGEITLTKQQIEKTINQNNLDFPMDYSGSVDSCTGIDIIIEPYGELKKKISAMQEFYPQNAQLLTNAIKVCTNKNLRLYKKIQFPIIDKEILVYTDEQCLND